MPPGLFAIVVRARDRLGSEVGRRLETFPNFVFPNLFLNISQTFLHLRLLCTIWYCFDVEEAPNLWSSTGCGPDLNPLTEK